MPTKLLFKSQSIQMQDVFAPQIPIKHTGNLNPGPVKMPISITTVNSRRNSLAESTSSAHSTATMVIPKLSHTNANVSRH